MVRAAFPNRLDGRPAAGDHVDHDEPAAVFGDEIDSLEHLGGLGGHVHEVVLALAGLFLGAVAGGEALGESVREGVERLVGEVLVVFQQVDTAAPGLLADAGVGVGREAHLGFRHRRQHRPLARVQLLARDARSELWARKPARDRFRPVAVLEPDRVDGFHPKDVAGDTREDLGHATVLEQRGRVRDRNRPSVNATGDCTEIREFVLVDV